MAQRGCTGAAAQRVEARHAFTCARKRRRVVDAGSLHSAKTICPGIRTAADEGPVIGARCPNPDASKSIVPRRGQIPAGVNAHCEASPSFKQLKVSVLRLSWRCRRPRRYALSMVQERAGFLRQRCCPWRRLLEEGKAEERCHRCSRKEGYEKLCSHEMGSHRDPKGRARPVPGTETLQHELLRGYEMVPDGRRRFLLYHCVPLVPCLPSRYQRQALRVTRALLS